MQKRRLRPAPPNIITPGRAITLGRTEISFLVLTDTAKSLRRDTADANANRMPIGGEH